MSGSMGIMGQVRTSSYIARLISMLQRQLSMPISIDKANASNLAELIKKYFNKR